MADIDPRPSLLRRLNRLQQIGNNPDLQAIELALCKRDVVHWFNHWAWTFDPKAVGRGRMAYLPFDLFPRQAELVEWVLALIAGSEEGVVEKSRDIGWTWVAAGIALNRWLFVPGFKTSFGSRKEDYVDKLGNLDAIFPKIRLLQNRLPYWMLPAGWNPTKHDNFMKLVNPENENTISGEAGDNIGRGGRSTLYVVDEGAFVEHGDAIDAAMNANSDCRIWASSVNGMGNTFARKRFSGLYKVFTFHWRHDPRKDEEWAKKKRAELIDDWKWASEYDIDYQASVEGVCIPAAWVKSSQRLLSLIPEDELKTGDGIGGVDVGGGKARSVFIARFGALVMPTVIRRGADTTDTAFWALDQAVAAGTATMNYDAVGVGAGVASTLSKTDKPGIATYGINTGIPASDITRWPDGRTSKEWFANLKAEIWWTMRERFRCTHEYVLFLEGEDGGQDHPLSTLIALPPKDVALAAELSLPKWFRTPKGQIMIEKKEDLARRGIASPDLAEALSLTFVASATPGLISYYEQLVAQMERERQEAVAAGEAA